ncbi:hypothetical protein P3L10_018363 [Capsicum annuum]
MLLALEDYNATANRSGIRIVSHLRDSKKDDVGAAFAAIYLLKDVQVQAIFGPQMSTQTDFVIDLGKRVKVPTISPATSPSLLVEENPFFIRGALPSSSQTKAIAAIVKNYDWREVVVIYKDSPYGTGIVPHFTDALLKISSSVSYKIVISPSADDDQIFTELYKLNTMQTRVSIVHVQPFLASRLFIKANEAGMMSSGYAWIITNVLTSLLDSIDPSVIESSMQGVLGVKPYVPRSNELHRFTKRWRKRFRQEYPDTDQVELNVFGLWAYDSITALAEAVEEVGTTAILKSKKPDTRENLTDFDALGTSEVGSLLIHSMQNAVLKTGLSGDFRIVDGELQASPFEIMSSKKSSNLCHMLSLMNLFHTNGLNLPVYDDFLHGITSLDYDAVVGDVTILARRSKYVDFTLPFTESGISAVVPVRDDEKRNAWIFLKPLKSELWITIGTFFVFIGFVVWVLEHRVNNEFRGPKHKQVGMIFWFSFSTLVFAHSAKITSNLTRFVLIVWVFMVLVLTSSYTASLTSMLTVQQLQPTITDLNDLIKNGEYVGYPESSFVKDVFVKHMKFGKSKFRSYSTLKGFNDALSRGSKNGGVGAIVDELPYLRLFLNKFCGKYIMFGLTYNAAGFGFAFPKGSPLVPDVSRAVLEKDAVSIISDSLVLDSFKGLFLTAGVSAGSALLIYVFIFIYQNREILATNDSIGQKISAIAKAFDEEKDNSNSKSENAEANESQTATLFAASEASSPEILPDLPFQSPEIRISDGLG